MADLSHSREMFAFQEALEKLLFLTNLLRNADHSIEDAYRFLLLDVEALEATYPPVKSVFEEMI